MTTYELDTEQMLELKQNRLCELYDETGESPSWGELATVDSIISDEEIHEEYAGVDFTEDDFFCSAGLDG